MYSDFYLKDFNIFIELAGMLSFEDYRQKMIFKQDTFNSIILKKQKEYEPFLKDLINGNITNYINRNI